MQRSTWLFSILALSITLFACRQDDSGLNLSSNLEDSNTIENALLDDFGGINTKDEPTAFSDAQVTAATDEVEGPIADNMLEDADVVAANAEAESQQNSSDPNACHKVFLQYKWGQLHFNPNMLTKTDWSGTLSTSSGALIVLSTIKFEKPGDHINLPRTDRKEIAFTSHTTVASDGLLVALLYGCSALSDVGAVPKVTLNTGPFVNTLDLAQNDTNYNETFDVDGLGNQVSIKAGKIKTCGGGFIHGGWKRVDDEKENGVFRGVLLNDRGEIDGWIKGIFGKKHWFGKERNVMFAKAIDKNGKFVMRLRGTYDKPAQDASAARYRMRGLDKQDHEFVVARGAYFKPELFDNSGALNGHWRAFCPDQPKANEDDMSETEFLGDLVQ